MIPFHSPSTTHILGEPEGWDEGLRGPCAGLPVTYVGGVFYSYWAPTMAQRDHVAAGGNIRLGVVGAAHPAVSLDTLI